MSQYLEPEPHRPRGATSQRTPFLTCLLSLWVVVAILAGSTLIIRILATQWSLWTAVPLGAVIGFVIVSALVVSFGRSANRIVIAVAIVLVTVGLLWKLPSHGRPGRYRSHFYARLLARHR